MPPVLTPAAFPAFTDEEAEVLAADPAFTSAFVSLASFGEPVIGENIWTNAVSAAPGAHSPDTIRLMPWPLRTPVTIDRLSGDVTTGGTGGDLVLVLYGSSPSGIPDGQPLLASAALNPASVSMQHVVLGAPVTLPVGLYWTGSLLHGASAAPSCRLPSPIRDSGMSGAAVLSGQRSVRFASVSSGTPPAVCPSTTPSNTPGCAVLARRSA